MLVVVARPGDRQAQRFVTTCGESRAAVLTPDDLSGDGWRFAPARPSEGTAHVAGRHIDVREITGVLVRSPLVFAHDLHSVAHDEQAYVAAEMTAFLVAWLAAVPCPVMNRPDPPYLTSPLRSDGQWRLIAANVGLRSEVGVSNARATVTATVVDGRYVGPRDADAESHVRALAQETGAASLAVRLAHVDRSWAFAGASPWVDVDDPSVANAVRIALAGDTTRERLSCAEA